MKGDESRSVVTAFFDRLSKQDFDGAMSLCAASCLVWIAAKPADSGPAHEGTVLDTATFTALLRRTAGVAPGGMRFTVRRTVVEGATVVAEAESVASLTDGRTYHNRYAFVFVVADGLITELREYLDTKHGHEFLLPLLSGG